MEKRRLACEENRRLEGEEKKRVMRSGGRSGFGWVVGGEMTSFGALIV